MIELTEALISSQDDVIEFRNKLMTLLLSLGYSDMKAIIICSSISDVIHHICFSKSSFKISYQFAFIQRSYQLLLQIHGLHNINEFKRFYRSLVSYLYYKENDEANTLDIFIFIPDHTFKPDQQFIQNLKDKMIIQTKTELLRQIKHKNEELSRLLMDLRKSSGLIQSEKMRALGVLTAGVAHELNNPMMGILNYIQYCLKKTEPLDKRFEVMKDAEYEIKRCIEIVNNLLTFSHLEKEGVIEFQPVDITILVQRVIKILSYKLRNENITLVENIAKNIPTVMGHENRLQQVILNLMTNAIDAMKCSEKKELGLSINTLNNYLNIIVSDTGEGMNEETQQRIFEPFYTTKPTGLGTGLGLSVCESIIKGHAGSIEFQTQLNKGTQFYIKLPIEKKETT